MHRRTVIAAALIVASGIAAYSNSFTDLFVGLDGKESIRDNPHIRRIWPLSEALSLPLWETPVVIDETASVAHRPTYSLSLAVINHFFGVSPRAHHATNLAIHIAAALVLFGTVGRTFRRQRFRPIGAADSTWLALAAALLWLLHPLQTESVTFIAQRAESLMGLMLLLTLYGAIRSADGRHRCLWQVIAIAACLVGTGSKQTAALAPLLILLYDYTFAEPGRPWWRGRFYLAVAAPAGVMLLTIAGKLVGHFELERYLAYALAQPGVVVHYLRLALWPDDLYVYVNTRLFDVHSVVEVIAPATFLMGLLVATSWAIRQRHWLGFVGAWFFVTLGPTSVIATSDIIQEHRMYLPLAALAVLATVAGDALLRTVLTALRPASQQGFVKAAVLLAVVAGLAARTYVRNWDYHHEFAMVPAADVHEDYRILADHYLLRPSLLPAEAQRAEELLRSSQGDRRDIAFAHFMLALSHEQRDELEKAEEELERMLRLEPDFAYGHHRLGVVLRSQGDLRGAVEHLRKAIHLEPQLVFAYKELALALKERGDAAGAAELLDQALRVQAGFGEGYYELGIIAVERGDLDDAAENFHRALRDRPDLAEAHYELGMIALKHHDPELARRHFEATIRLRPDFTEAYFELGMRWRDRGDFDRAAEYLEHAVRLRPDSADFSTELGWVELKRGNHRVAAEHFRRALALDPNYTDAMAGLEELQRLPDDPSSLPEQN